MPANKKRFKRLPTPKYFKIRNIVKNKEKISPLLEFEKRVASVKSRAKNTTVKNTGTIAKVSGSTK